MAVKYTPRHKVLHMIDHGTRESVAAKIPNKVNSSIVKRIFKHPVSYFRIQNFLFSFFFFFFCQTTEESLITNGLKLWLKI